MLHLKKVVRAKSAFQLILINNQRQYKRTISTTNDGQINEQWPSPSNSIKLKSESKINIEWNRAVSEAERIVGYPTSFLSLRWLLSDEIANVALILRKLVGSNHPLLKTARQLLYNGKDTMQSWGLIVLLISKTAGHAPTIPDMEQDVSAGVMHKQRGLAEITEMIRIANIVHNNLLNLKAKKIVADSDELLGNKIGLLTGDYLLSNSSAALASLRNQDVLELLSSAVRDFSESAFIGERDGQNKPLPSKPIKLMQNQHQQQQQLPILSIDFDVVDVLKPLDIQNIMGVPDLEWEFRSLLNTCSLLAKSCQGAMMLAQLDKTLQRDAYFFGKHLSLAWQAGVDARPFLSNFLAADTPLNLTSAPVLYHLEYDPTFYYEIQKGKENVDNIDYVKVLEAVKEGPGLQRTKELQLKHMTDAMRMLKKFPYNEAHVALENIIMSSKNF